MDLRASRFWISMWIAAGIGIVFLALPVVSLLWRAVDYRDSLGQDRTQGVLLDAIWLSLATSITAMVLVVVFGTPIAWILARSKSRAARIADAVIDLPILLPPA